MMSLQGEHDKTVTIKVNNKQAKYYGDICIDRYAGHKFTTTLT